MTTTTALDSYVKTLHTHIAEAEFRLSLTGNSGDIRSANQMIKLAEKELRRLEQPVPKRWELLREYTRDGYKF